MYDEVTRGIPLTRPQLEPKVPGYRPPRADHARTMIGGYSISDEDV